MAFRISFIHNRKNIPLEEMITKEKKMKERKRIAKVVNNIYDTIYNPELIIKEIKHTNNNWKFRNRILVEDCLSISIYSFLNDNRKFS